jgi:hypothetical protein
MKGKPRRARYDLSPATPIFRPSGRQLEDALSYGLEEIAGRHSMTLSDRSAHAAIADLVAGEQPGDSVQDGPRSRWRSRHVGFTPES